MAYIGQDGEEIEVEEEDEDEMIDYGSMSDGGDMPNAGKEEEYPSSMSKMEIKKMQDNEIINEAVNEFIQDKRLWFRDLHKDHKDDIEQQAIEKGNNFKEGTAKFIGKGLIPIADQMDEKSEEYKILIKERTLAN